MFKYSFNASKQFEAQSNPELVNKHLEHVNNWLTKQTCVSIFDTKYSSNQEARI